MLRSVSCQTRMLIYLFLKKALQETLKIFKKSNLKYLLTGENLNLKLMYCIIWNSLHYRHTSMSMKQNSKPDESVHQYKLDGLND